MLGAGWEAGVCVWGGGGGGGLRCPLCFDHNLLHMTSP